MTVQIAMVTLYGLLPLVCYLIGAAMFTRFKFDEAAHRTVRAELDKRKRQRQATAP